MFWYGFALHIELLRLYENPATELQSFDPVVRNVSSQLFLRKTKKQKTVQISSKAFALAERISCSLRREAWSPSQC